MWNGPENQLFWFRKSNCRYSNADQLMWDITFSGMLFNLSVREENSISTTSKAINEYYTNFSLVKKGNLNSTEPRRTWKPITIMSVPFLKFLVFFLCFRPLQKKSNVKKLICFKTFLQSFPKYIVYFS